MSLLSSYVSSGSGGSSVKYKREVVKNSTTWAVPSNIVDNTVYVTLIGGGGGGIRTANVDTDDYLVAASGGQYFYEVPVDLTGESSVAIAIGAGGTGGTVPTDGVSTTFGTFITALGGGKALFGSTDFYNTTLYKGYGAAGGRRFASSDVLSNSYHEMQGQPTLGKYAAPASVPLFRTNQVQYWGPSAGSGLLIDTFNSTATLVGSLCLGYSGIGYGAGGGSGDGSGNANGDAGIVVIEWFEEA